MADIENETENNMRTFPIVEDFEKEYQNLVERNFSYLIPNENQITTMGIGDTVSREELLNLRSGIIAICQQYGFNSPSETSKNLLTQMDKEIGEYIYKTMNITPSFAATLQIWHFLNLCLIPDVIKWRWGDSKDHFTSTRRNYLGTQWWRYYLFNITKHTLKKYMEMSDRDVADLYERTNSRGLPEHIANISLWFDELDKNNVTGKSQELYREVLKEYNAQLAYRLYFSFSVQERFELFAKCYQKCKISM